MQNRILIYFSLFLSSVIMFSCKQELTNSSNVPAKKILRSYHIIWTNDGPAYVTATFSTNVSLDVYKKPMGRSRVVLDKGSSVTFNGEPMEYKKSMLQGSVYKAKITGTWPGKFVWVWTDNKGKKHKDVAKVDSIKLKRRWLRNARKGYAMVWDGSPIQKYESVSVSIKKGEKDYHDKSKKVGARMVVNRRLPIGFMPSLYNRTRISRDYYRKKLKVVGKNDFGSKLYGGSEVNITFISEN